MLAAYYIGSGNLWVHGAMMELGFELCDAIYLLFGLGAWGFDGVKKELKATVMFHHLPGLTLLIPVRFIYLYLFLWLDIAYFHVIESS